MKWCIKVFCFFFRKYSFKNKGHILNSLDSDSEEEPLKRPVANSQKQCDFQSREQQQEELEKVRKQLVEEECMVIT